MLFSDLYKSPRSPLSKLRHSQPQASLSLPGPDYDADLVSRDKTRQKEAVKRHLAERIRNDWQFVWPPSPPPPPQAAGATAPPRPPPEAGVSGDDSRDDVGDDKQPSSSVAPPPPAAADDGYAADPERSDVESVYSTVSEDPLRYRPRADWTSDWSDGEAPASSAAATSPFRFDTPESVGPAIRASAAARKAKRRRDDRAEMEWNAGLACFSARRDAWTGARTLRVKPKPPASPAPALVSPRRSRWRFHGHSKSEPAAPLMPAPAPAPAAPAAPLSPVTSNSRHSQHSAPDAAAAAGTALASSDGDSHASSSGQPAPPRRSSEDYAVETLVPVPVPLLPPENPMRASISPAIYLSLYDKVVAHSLQPSCPINLADMTRSCVAGWKRDGEWPPRPVEVPAAAAVVVVRKKKKEERREATRERRDSVATAASAGRRMSLSAFLGRPGADERREADREQHDESGSGKGIRRSLQRVLGLGHGHSASVGGAIEHGAGQEVAG